MRFRKIISGSCRCDTGEWLDSDEDKRWYEGLREAVQRCRDEDDARHCAYEDFDAAGRALVDSGVERILTAMDDSVFVPRWCCLELHKAFVISYDADAECSSHAEHTDPGSDVTINCPLTPDEEYEGGELMLRVFPSEVPQDDEEATNEYIKRVKEEPDVYSKFSAIIMSFQRNEFDAPGYVQRISALFAGRSTLLYGFNMFLPEGNQIEVPAVNVTPRLGAVVVHAGCCQHGARPLTRGKRSALILWTKRRCAFDNLRHVPDDVQRKYMLPYWTWRDQVTFAAATTRCRRLVAPSWANARVQMERRVMLEPRFDLAKLYDMPSTQSVVLDQIERMRTAITSAPPGRDAIAGTIATLVAVADAYLPPVNSASPLFPDVAARSRVERQHRFVIAALESLLRDDVSVRHHIRPWDMWFDESLVKDGVDSIKLVDYYSASPALRGDGFVNVSGISDGDSDNRPPSSVRQ